MRPATFRRRTPSRRWAAASQPETWDTVIPSAREEKTARKAVRVIAQARRMSASSWASFTMRQPAVTGVALASRAAGSAWPIPSENANGIASSN